MLSETISDGISGGVTARKQSRDVGGSRGSPKVPG